MDFRLKLTNHASNRFATPKGKEQIIAALNLVSRFKTSNMHLWGPDGTIKRYNSPQEVIRDFFPVRLKYYEERKKRLEEHLGRVLMDLQNKHRFCKMVIDGSLKLFKKSKKEIEQILKDLGFAMQNKSFSYLLGISMLDLTTDRLVELEKKLELREKELEGLKAGAKNPISMFDGYNFDGAKAYKDSKLCLMMTSNLLHDKYHKQTGISFSSIYPGCIAESPLFREKRPWFRKYFPVFMKYITGGFLRCRN